MTNQEFKAKEQNIKGCRILGSVAGSQGSSKLRIFSHAWTLSALFFNGMSRKAALSTINSTGRTNHEKLT